MINKINLEISPAVHQSIWHLKYSLEEITAFRLIIILLESYSINLYSEGDPTKAKIEQKLERKWPSMISVLLKMIFRMGGLPIYPTSSTVSYAKILHSVWVILVFVSWSSTNTLWTLSGVVYSVNNWNLLLFQTWYPRWKNIWIR